jgi:hypothetical protein
MRLAQQLKHTPKKHLTISFVIQLVFLVYRCIGGKARRKETTRKTKT